MELERALKRLLIKSPFYGLFCLSLPKRETKSIPTLAVAKKGINCELLVNPDFWAEHTDDEQIALLEHELSHIALQHMFISESFSNSYQFNIAADCEVNSYIMNLPKSAVTAKTLSDKLHLSPPLQNGLGVKKYYEEMQKPFLQQQNNSSKKDKKRSSKEGNSNNENIFKDLSQIQKRCVMLRRMKKMSISDISAKLGITEEEVEKALNSGYKIIKSKLDSNGI